ncbi:hypothetical protein L596_007849 [Steinernema carpocapsae]|uniref:Uncharacterized protein n=1 Tax=Steinernema carpocapsae TaxID=34508 RepID=A0A4U5PAZ0_STECR|nr:hypothetical protein L596_007849 [Steinernema carpocapsae]
MIQDSSERHFSLRYPFIYLASAITSRGTGRSKSSTRTDATSSTRGSRVCLNADAVGIPSTDYAPIGGVRNAISATVPPL